MSLKHIVTGLLLGASVASAEIKDFKGDIAVDKQFRDGIYKDLKADGMEYFESLVIKTQDDGSIVTKVGNYFTLTDYNGNGKFDGKDTFLGEIDRPHLFLDKTHGIVNQYPKNMLDKPTIGESPKMMYQPILADEPMAGLLSPQIQEAYSSYLSIAKHLQKE